MTKLDPIGWGIAALGAGVAVAAFCVAVSIETRAEFDHHARVRVAAIQACQETAPESVLAECVETTVDAATKED